MKDLNGNTIHTANITMSKEHGIGKWTEAQFVRTLTQGFRPDNTPLHYPMERYPELTEAEAASIFSYLQTIPVLDNPRKPNIYVNATAKTAKSEGQTIYEKYACTSCHGDAGYANCDLRQAAQKYPSDSLLIAFVKNPSKLLPGTKMPNWEGVIAEEEYQPLVEYVKQLCAGAPQVKTASVAK
jgi:cytochrome c2